MSNQKRELTAADLAAAFSEIQRRRSNSRITYAGGRLPSCDCGTCEKCVKREKMRMYRARKIRKSGKVDQVA